jgi:hypothetical protein
MHGGGKTAQTFHRHVLRHFPRQQRQALVLTSLGLMAQATILSTERHAGVNGQTQLGFQLTAVGHPAAQTALQEDHHHPKKQAQQQAQERDHALARLDWLFRNHCLVDDAHIAQGTGTDDAQFLCLVQ